MHLPDFELVLFSRRLLDFLYQEAFLTTYRTMIEPKELINKLLYRYRLFATTTSNVVDKQSRKASKNAFSLLVRVLDELGYEPCYDFRLLSVTIIQNYIQTSSNDELNEDLIEMFEAFVSELIISDQLQLARVLRKRLMNKIDVKLSISSSMATKQDKTGSHGITLMPIHRHFFR